MVRYYFNKYNIIYFLLLKNCVIKVEIEDRTIKHIIHTIGFSKPTLPLKKSISAKTPHTRLTIFNIVITFEPLFFIISPHLLFISYFFLFLDFITTPNSYANKIPIMNQKKLSNIIPIIIPATTQNKDIEILLSPNFTVC